MGTCEEGNTSHETQNEITSLETNGTHYNIVVEGDDDVDDGDQQNHKQNQDQNQQPTEEDSAIVEKLESLELQGNGNGANGGEEIEREEEGEEEEGKTHNYPLRPHAVDCTFYLKTGTCKFGLNCRFNHPQKRVFQPIGDKEKDIEESNEVVLDAGQIECKYFSTPGGCKYGDACRYNHSKEKVEVKGPELNFLGLPIRPLEKECTFFMRNGTCGYGANCRFHHPDPTAAKKSEPGNSVANGDSLRGVNNFPKTYQPLHSVGASQGILPDLSNGISLRNSIPYTPGMSTFHQGMLQNSGWNQNQVTMQSANIPPLPHHIVNNFSKKTDPSTHYEHPMQNEEFPERPGQPDCDYFMKTGDCKYRSACRYNHPISRATKLSLPPLSSKGPYSRSATILPLKTTQLSNSNPIINTRKIGVPSAHHHQQMQDGEFPERPGQPECEYFIKTGNCKFRSACRYHHPRNRVSTSSACALSEKGLPLRPGGRICRNYEQQGTCKYGRNCLFHHPEDRSPTVPVVPVAAQDHSLTDVAVTAADMEPPASNNAASDWDDGWVM